MVDGVSQATRVPGTQAGIGPDVLTVPVEVGRRALVVANLGLKPEATPATTWASSGLARALDTWEGPGLVVIAGNLLDLIGEPDAAAAGSAALAAHPRLEKALEAFAAGEDRRVVSIPGETDSALGTDAAGVVVALGVEMAPAVGLHMATAAGTRIVRVEAGVPSAGLAAATTGDSPGRNGATPRGPRIDTPSGTDHVPGEDPGPLARSGSRPGAPGARDSGRGTFTLSPDPAAEWQDGLGRLADPANTPAF